MTLPWDDPSATGYGRMVDEVDYAKFTQQSRDALRRKSHSVLGEGSPFIGAILDFADVHDMYIQRDGSTSGTEIWKLKLEYERMDRYIVVLVRFPEDSDRAIEIRSASYWMAHSPDQGSCATTIERRWFGFTTSSPVSMFGASLELALKDAKSYRLDELVPLEDASVSARSSFGRQRYPL